MNPPPTEETLFAAALQRPGPAARAAFLAEACAGDPALRGRVEELLRAADDAATFLEAPAADPAAETLRAAAPAEGPGARIGRYKLLQQIGEGGCGTVFMAEQEEPVRRRVALKVIKLGMDTKSVIARFEAERQALAMMDHPNIAKVLDAGATDSGRPFFVMELVRGIPITRYCDENRLDTRARLDLFIKVCQAVQHAHQKGIIHRDIKPSNILVTLHDGVPVPKVIDFGIAKATEGRLTDQTLFTAFEQFIGTPAYMSPEQAELSGLDIDTRSDIYSLGVLLYELLAGSTPFDAKELMASGIDAMRKTIREKEPPRPSTRLTMELSRLGSARASRAASGVAPDARSANSKASGESQFNEGFGGTPHPARGTRALPEHLRTLIYALRGDLDWIVMKCLEKDRQRRYETANGLAADLKRHLNNEPVVARPPSAAYKFQKAFRRNKLAFAAGGIVVVGLLIGLAALAYALVQERALKSESARADSIATFVTGLLKQVVPQLDQQGNSAGIRVLLESADELVSTTLTNSPAAELIVRNSLQYFYGYRLGDYQGARKQTDRMESLLPLVTDDRLPPNHPRDDLRIDAAAARLWAGAVTQGRADLEKLAEEFKKRGPAANRARARTLANLGGAFEDLNKPLEAETLLAEAYQLEPGRTGPGFFPEDFAGHVYSSVLIRNGKYALAEEVARVTVNQVNAELGKAEAWKEAVELRSRLGNIHCYPSLVEALCRLGRFQEADALLVEQLGPGAARPWTPAQLESFKKLQLIVQAHSGHWREAAPGLIALATNSQASVKDWARGAAAALAAGDTSTYDRLGRLGRMRFAGIAEGENAFFVFSGLILRPHEEDLAHTLPGLLHHVEESKDYHWSAVHLPFLNSQLSYRKGEYKEALRSLDAWVQSRDERPVNALELSNIRAFPFPDFWRAMILARMDRAEGARTAYGDGLQKLRATFPPSSDWNGAVMTFYASHALHQEAREVLRSQGIAVPDIEKSP